MTPSERRPPRFDGHQYPQIIPDPGEIEVGGLAPWSGTSRRKDLSLEHVRAQLRDAHRLLGTDIAPDQPEELALVADGAPAPIRHRSAVLVALFEESGESHVVLTRRSFEMRSHRGEIAFPGGRGHELGRVLDEVARLLQRRRVVVSHRRADGPGGGV